MKQLNIFLILFIALWCVLDLVNGEQKQVICVPLGSVPYEPYNPNAPIDCSSPGFKINYSDRSLFTVCADGIRYNFKCQNGLYFDLINERCEYLKSLECNPLEEICPNGSIPVIPVQSGICDYSERGYYSNPFDASLFYQCWEGKRFEFKCQHGLLFDRSNKRCEWPHNMRCYELQ